MYNIKRADALKFSVRVGGKKLTHHMRIDDLINDYNRLYTKLIELERKFEKEDVVKSDPKVITEFGDTFIAILNHVLGRENTTYIIRYFDNQKTEIAQSMQRFIVKVVTPKIAKWSKEKRAAVAKKYK